MKLKCSLLKFGSMSIMDFWTQLINNFSSNNDKNDCDDKNSKKSNANDVNNNIDNHKKNNNMLLVRHLDFLGRFGITEYLPMFDSIYEGCSEGPKGAQ